MPTDKRFGLDDCDGIEDRRKPSIQLDEELAIAVREPNPATHLTPQHHQLVSERRVPGFKSALRLKRRGQDGKEET